MHTHVRNTINAIIIVCGTARSVCIIVYVAAKGLIFIYVHVRFQNISKVGGS